MSDWDDKLLNDEKVLFETEKHWASPLWDSWKAILMILGVAGGRLASDRSDQRRHGVRQPRARPAPDRPLPRRHRLDRLQHHQLANGRVRGDEHAVLGHEGLVRTRATDTLLTSLADVRVKIPAVGKMLGFGDMTITSSSGEAGQDTFTTVRKVEEFKKTIFQQKTAQGDKQIDRMAGAAKRVPRPAAATATAGALADLAKLRDAGAITPAEYDAKKAELLARI